MGARGNRLALALGPAPSRFGGRSRPPWRTRTWAGVAPSLWMLVHNQVAPGGAHWAVQPSNGSCPSRGRGAHRGPGARQARPLCARAWCTTRQWRARPRLGRGAHGGPAASGAPLFARGVALAPPGPALGCYPTARPTREGGLVGRDGHHGGSHQFGAPNLWLLAQFRSSCANIGL